MVYWYKKYTPRFIQQFLKKIEPERISYWKLDRISKKTIDFSGHGETQAVKQYLKNDNDLVKLTTDSDSPISPSVNKESETRYNNF